MSTNFPTSLDSLTNPTSSDPVSSPSHAGQHSDENDAIEALEAKVGADGSAVTTSHDYKLSTITGSDKAVSLTGSQTLTNKTLTSPVINTPTLTVLDAGLTIQDNADPTKQFRFEASGIGAGVTRSVAIPNSDTTLLISDQGHTLTGPTAARTITLPDENFTVVGLATTQALSNKTIGNTNTVTLKDTLFTIQDDGDATKLLAFQLSGITTGNTRTLTVPDASGTFVLTAATQTISGKTLTEPKFANGGFIADANGNEAIVFVTTASAVTYLELTPGATGNGMILKAAGETNVDLKLDAAGSGTIRPLQAVINMVVALSDGANIATDASLGNIFTVTLAGNRTLDNPTNAVDGQVILYLFKQDGTGSRTITFGSNFRGSTDVALPTLTTTANYMDAVLFIYRSAVTKWDCLAVNKGFAT